MWWFRLAAASTTVTSSLLLRRFNKVHQTSFFTTTTTFDSSSSSSSKFGTIILQTNEPSVGLDKFREKKPDIIKMFRLSSVSGEEDKDDDEKKKKKKKKEKMVFKLDEDLGFSALYKDFQLQDSLRMVGSCNGIICLHDPMDMSSRDVYLWNPATRQCKILPRHISRGILGNEFVGFGFDVETQDYKVLRITPIESYSGDVCKCLVQVYSLSTDTWRVLDGIDSLPVSPTKDMFGNRQGAYLDGSCFFLGSKPINHNGIRDLMLLSFDFTREIFTIRELPECLYHKLVFSFSGEEDFDFNDVLTSPRLNHFIADKEPVFFRTPGIDFAGGNVFTTVRFDIEGGGYDWYYNIWSFNEQHNIGSSRVVVYEPKLWSNLHKFVPIKTKSKHHHPCSEPRCVSNDGEFALISTTLTDDDNGRRKEFMLFNLATGKAIEDFTIGDRNCSAAYVYEESQVSILGGGGENTLLRWQLPTHGTTYKLNLEIDSCCILGIGLCLTSDTGGCIGVRSISTCECDRPGETEATAMLEAIKWAKELELSPIIIESDSKNMVSFFMDDDDDYYDDDYYEVLSLLREAKLLLKSSENSISLQYCPRSCNYVAGIASKLGLNNNDWYSKDWTANFPGEVVMSLSKDLGRVSAR